MTEIWHLRSDLPLDEAARRVFAALSVASFEERDSENYPTGRYFLGRGPFGKIKVALESDAGFEDCRYWVVVSRAARPAGAAAQALAAAGLWVCRELPPSAGSARREVFEPLPDGRVTRREENAPPQMP